MRSSQLMKRVTNSESIQKKLRIFNKPYPNPFTPLSADEDFNQVVFPARAIEDASGEFTVHIYDIDGMLVKSLTALPGETKLTWDGRDEVGENCGKWCLCLPTSGRRKF